MCAGDASREEQRVSERVRGELQQRLRATHTHPFAIFPAPDSRLCGCRYRDTKGRERSSTREQGINNKGPVVTVTVSLGVRCRSLCDSGVVSLSLDCKQTPSCSLSSLVHVSNGETEDYQIDKEMVLRAAVES